MKQYQNFIGGEWVPAKSGKTFTNVNPADTRESVAEYAAGDAEDAKAAVDAAGAAFAQWSGMTPVARGRILSKTSELLAAKKAELTELLTREEGKTLFESGLEVQRAIDIFRFFGGNSYTIGGQTFPHDLPNILMYTQRQPLGVVAQITPWNFPIAIPAWKLAPALITGNTVVVKPASLTPALTFEVARALDEAGLPKGVLNVLTGGGSTVGTELATNSAVKALSFTGSYSVGHRIYQQLAERMARPQMEMGGKNPTIVLADADLDLAAQLTAVAGFGLTGQACTATSRAIVERSVVEEFTAKLIAKAEAIKVGNGLTEGTNMGPAVNEQELIGNLEHIEQAKEDGAKILTGGNRLTEGDHEHGYYMEPTVIGGVTPDMRIAQEEVFGPVVAIIPVDSYEEAVQVANNVEFGLSASIVTKDVKKAMLYTNSIEAGVVKVNQISTGLALNVPFGGVKHSSSDLFKEQGPGAIDFYTRIKTVYLDYSA